MEITEKDRARFDKKLVKSPEPDGCWMWSAGKNPRGYGLFNIRGKVWLAHRLAFAMAHGEIPNEQLVRHTCPGKHTEATRACCRPDHLAVGTHAQNSADRHEHGTGHINVGEDNARHVLTGADALAIYADTEATQSALAERFGVSQNLVMLIKKGRAWAHVTGAVPIPAVPRSDRDRHAEVVRFEAGVASDADRERFWAKVDKTGEHWLWTAATAKDGYGVFHWQGRKIEAHRFAYIAEVGPIPHGLDVAHECAIDLCMRPEHLIPRTRVDNMANAETRERLSAAKKGNRYRSKFSPEQEREIAARVDAGESKTALARELGVSDTAIGKVCTRVLRSGGHDNPVSSLDSSGLTG